MVDTNSLGDRLGERIGVPTSSAVTLIDPLVKSPRFVDVLGSWIARDDVRDYPVGEYTVPMVMQDFGVPALSAIVLMGWLDIEEDRLLPRFASTYDALRDSAFRPATADPREIVLRVVKDAGIFSDGGVTGYELLASMPEVQIAYWTWRVTNEVPELKEQGFSLRRMAEPSARNPSRHPIQAMLSIDWLIKQPERARRFLAEEPRS